MTQEEIVDYNKRCAEFLGFKYHEGSEYWTTLLWGGNGFTLRQMRFHSDWNWIMEVVEAISNKFGEAPLFKEVYQKWLYEDKDAEDFLIFRLSKEAVVQAINQFLIWYNQNKT